ncbi:hypothetical protein CY34DRAFT_812046, partial [Suillus luteus UH-Slu-Lm8-n1]
MARNYTPSHIIDVLLVSMRRPILYPPGRAWYGLHQILSSLCRSPRISARAESETARPTLLATSASGSWDSGTGEARYARRRGQWIR